MLLAPVVTATAENDAVVAEATRRVLARPIDHVVVTTGIGLRSWVAMAWSWGLGDGLLDLLATTPVWARGAKAVGALISEGLPTGRDAGATLAEVLDALLVNDLTGRRVAVQCHGGDQQWFLDALAHAGADVVPVPVYRLQVAASAGIERLLAAVAAGQLDAITFTSPLAVQAVVAHPDLAASLRTGGVRGACVGPVTAAAARAEGISGLVVGPTHRLGSMLRSLGDEMGPRGTSFEIDGVQVRHQGNRIAVDDEEVRLTPRERRLLEAMLSANGGVLSKDRLAATAWDEEVDGHTVEVTVNRLRRKLGPAAAAVETTNRRGYRIAV